MRSDQEIISLIEAWSEKRMNPAQLEEFETLMATDARVAHLVAKYKKAIQAVDLLKQQDMSKLVKQWQSTMTVLPQIKDRSRIGNYFKIYKGYILIFSLITIGFTYWILRVKDAPVSTLNEEAIKMDSSSMENNIVPDSMILKDTSPESNEPEIANIPVSPRSLGVSYLKYFSQDIKNKYGATMGTSSTSTFDLGIKAYMEKKYKIADSLFNLLPTDTDDYILSREFLASIYYEEKKYDEAIISYSMYTSKFSNPLSDLRLLQFYLLAYDQYANKIWDKIDVMTSTTKTHLYRTNALQIKNQLMKAGYNQN